VAHRARGTESSEEAALARAAASGKTEAFAELVRRYEGPLLRFLSWRCASREDAEELCQESFLRAWEQIERYDPRWRFSTWLFTLARRLAISARRRTAPDATQASSVEQLGVTHGPAEQADRRELSEGVWALSERLLSEDQRTALWLRYAEDHSAEEIGRVLGRRPAAVRVLLFRARTVLAEHLDPSLVDGPPSCDERAPFLSALRTGQAMESGS
jgi:RNA polymerase sigma-70 factor (ECF subfamily)